VRIKPEIIALKYHRLAGGGIPVNLGSLCRRLKVLLLEWDGPPDFTAAYSEADRAIVVNRNMLIARRRFSVAHELGHLALGKAGVQFFGERGRAERAANRFAAALLMPADPLKRLWHEYGCNAGFREDILAYQLMVSQQALRARAEELGLRVNR